jgi:plasmid stabilization system protein ParE
MRKLLYRPSAEADFEEILEFIARDNIDRALSFTEELRQQCRRISTLPGTLGTARPTLRADLRSFAYKGYVILFRYIADAVEIVNVIEGHRDIDSIFK